MGTDGQTHRETEFALHRFLSEPKKEGKRDSLSDKSDIIGMTDD